MPEKGSETPMEKIEFVSSPEITKNDILALEIKLDNLPNGSQNHHYKSKLSLLNLRLERFNKNGWTQTDVDDYLDILDDVKTYIRGLELQKLQEGF